MVSTRHCLSPEQLTLFVGGGGDREELERHVEGCEPCRRAVAAMVRAAREPAQVASEVTERVEGLTAVARRAHIASEASDTVLATLRDEEIQTARTMIRMGRIVGLAAIAPVPLFGGVLGVKIVFVAIVLVAIGFGIVVERQIRDPARYRESTMLALAVMVVCASVAGNLYYGIFSAAQLFPVLTLYVFSRRERIGNTLVVYAVTAIVQALVAALVIGGVISDGLFRPPESTALLVVGHVLIQIGDLAAFLVGTQSRRSTQTALENMQHVMVLAARREVLLQEAREELDRAIRIGSAGRYTDHTFGGYRLGAVIGRGGMGEVYEARHVETDAQAAVKMLPPRELANPRSLERFVREARAVSALRSPHVVRVLAASDAGDPIPYLVMERLHGRTLAQVLREAPAPALLLELLDQVGDALEEAWALAIVHRDLKPQNLFEAEVVGGRAWKVLDFGVASLGDHGGTLTRGHVIGTPAYMAPEQARGERVDYRADLYALAAIAYRWLTGRPVFGSGPEWLYQVVHGAPLQPSVVASVSPDVDAVLAIGLAKDPVDRWTTVAELRAALALALVGQLDARTRQRGSELVSLRPWRDEHG